MPSFRGPRSSDLLRVGSVESLIEAQMRMKNTWSSPNIRIPLDMLGEAEDEEGSDDENEDESFFALRKHGVRGGVAEAAAPAVAAERPNAQGSKGSATAPANRAGKRVAIRP